MPRPQSNTFARQLGLQAIMWGIFAIAFLGAMQLSSSRERGLRIGPLLPAVQIGWVKIALPKGWAVQADHGQMMALEPPHDGIQRELVVSQEQLKEPPEGDYLDNKLNHEVRLLPIEFPKLQATGEYAQVTMRDEQTGAATQEFIASVILPNDVAVVVQLRGLRGFGPNDSESFKAIIDAIEPGRDPTTMQVHRHLVGPFEPIGDWRDD